MADTGLDELKPKSITNFTKEEASDFADVFSQDLMQRLDSEAMGISTANDLKDDEEFKKIGDPALAWPSDAGRSPLHFDFLEAFKGMLAEVLSDKEIQILLRMKKKGPGASMDEEPLLEKLKTLAISLDLEKNKRGYYLEDDEESFFRYELKYLIKELHKQRTQYAESQQNVKFDELAEQVSELKELVEQLQARVEQVVPKE